MPKKDRIGVCRLCKKSKPLCNSHIVPEFCYKRAYDSQHRVIDMNLRNRGGPPARFLQKGHREPLLCGSCETRISRYETDFATYWYGPTGLPAKVDSGCEALVLSGAPYAAFKLFHISILWRAAVSTLCQGVNLGPYESKMRLMLLVGEPGDPSHFPVAGQVLIDEAGQVMHGLVTSPARYKSPPSYAYRACYAGCEWHIVVTDHPNAGQQLLAQSVNTAGEVVLLITGWLSTGSITAIRDYMARREKSCSR